MSITNEVKKESKSISRIQKMTVERLRNFKGFETYNDQKAGKVIQELEKYAKIVIQHMTKKKK